MKAGYLNDYFKAVAVKRLSSVETDADVSSQKKWLYSVGEFLEEVREHQAFDDCWGV